MKFLKTLLGIETKPQSPEEDMPGFLATMGRAFFTLDENLKEIRRFKLSREDELRVRMGLEALGLFLAWKGIDQAVRRVIGNTQEAQNIIRQISGEIQDAFTQQLLDDRLPSHVVADVNNSIISPLYHDISIYLQNPKESFPDYTRDMGIISIILLRTLGERKAREVIEVNLLSSKKFQYLDIQSKFDNYFQLLLIRTLSQGEPIANQIDDILRQYLEKR